MGSRAQARRERRRQRAIAQRQEPEPLIRSSLPINRSDAHRRFRAIYRKCNRRQRRALLAELETAVDQESA
jgi:hypothetical protein